MYPVPPRRRARLKWIVWGALVALAGLVALIIGALGTLVVSTAASIDPDAQGRTPGSVTFTAEDDGYEVLLKSSRRDDRQSAASVNCTVTLSDGSIAHLDGSRQAVSVEAANVYTIGRFDATAGPTTVFCDASGDNQFLIDRESAASRIGLWLLIGGAVFVFAGGGLITAGALLKR